MDEVFSCNCNGGKTERVSEDRVIHTCGFRPSASYGSLGVATPYRRVQVNPALTSGEARYNWFADYSATARRESNGLSSCCAAPIFIEGSEGRKCSECESVFQTESQGEIKE